jgi:uncharacterized protein YndB with AHSA1/START domain
MVQIHEQRTIAASPERVFAWLLDPANLTISAWFRTAAWVKDSSGPGVGATRELKGFGFWVHEQITAYDRPVAPRIALSGGSHPRIKTGRSHVLRRATERISIG